MATPDERAARIRGNLNTRAERLSGNNNSRAERIRGNLTARAQRQTRDLVEGLQGLMVPERPLPRLPRAEPRGAIPAARGYSERNHQPGTEDGSEGVASPFTEGATPAEGPVLDREYWDTTQSFSYDYLLAFEIKPLKVLKMRDAENRLVELRFADPSDTPPPDDGDD